MHRKRNLVVSIAFRVIVCAGLLLLAGGIFSFLVATRPTPETTDVGQPPPRVLVMQAQPVPARRQWEGFGTAAAMDAADVPARIVSTVVERPEYCRPGQPVAKGQLLVRLDDSDFVRQVEMASQAIEDLDAQLARLELEAQSWARRVELAEEDVRLAQAEYDRVRQAFEGGAAKQRELDQARLAIVTAQRTEVAAREEVNKIAPRRASLLAQRSSQESNLRLAKLSVERSRIVSPLDGVIESVDVEVGENVALGQRVARVVSLKRIEVPLLLPASARPLVALGDAVRLESTAATDQSWSARVARISPTDDESTRTMRVYAELEQSPGDAAALAPGAFVRGIVVSSQPLTRWVVPRRALNSERVLLVENGVVKSRDIVVDFQLHADLPALGLPDQQWVVLKHPLPDQAMVVVDGSRSLVDGVAITPVPAGQVASDAASDQSDRSDAAHDPIAPSGASAVRPNGERSS